MRTLFSLANAFIFWHRRLLARFEIARQERAAGQGLVEYGLILVLIAVTCVAIMTIVGQQVSGAWYQRIYDSLDAIIN
jgi:Flp pilus assembly pilin Flp